MSDMNPIRRILKRHKPIDVEFLQQTVCTTCRRPDAPAIPGTWPCPEILDLIAIYNLTTETPTVAPMRITTTSAAHIAPPDWLKPNPATIAGRP